MGHTSKHLILLVEDNSLVQWAVEQALLDAGFACLSVSTGDAAIEEMTRNISRFRAVLTDIRLPGPADGWDVAIKCRQLSWVVPVVYITGDPTAELPSGDDGWSLLLRKPFTDAQLYSALTSITGCSISIPGR